MSTSHIHDCQYTEEEYRPRGQHSEHEATSPTSRGSRERAGCCSSTTIPPPTDDELESLCRRVAELWDGGRVDPAREGEGRRLRLNTSGRLRRNVAGPVRWLRAMEAAFFDLDKTAISRSSTLALSRPLYRAGLVSRGQLLRGAYAQLVYLLVGADEERWSVRGVLQLTKGWDRAQVERLVDDVLLEATIPTSTPRRST